MGKGNGDKNKIAIIILSVLCCLSVAVLVVAAAITLNNKNRFVPPDFDESVIKGTPEVPEGLGYSPIEVEQGYNVYVCGNLIVNGNNVDVYFTSPETNTVWVLLRMVDEYGTVLGETGIVQPGEYIKSLRLNTVPEQETNVKLKIIAYQPETYISMGSVGLKTKLKLINRSDTK